MNGRELELIKPLFKIRLVVDQFTETQSQVDKSYYKQPKVTRKLVLTHILIHKDLT